MMSRTNIVLVVLLLVVASLAATSGVDYSRPNIEILPDMKYSPAWSAYEPNENFPNGRTLQSPVAGSIARGAMPLHYEATKEDAVRAGQELQNPYTPDTAAPADDDQPADQDKPPEAGSADERDPLQASVERGREVFRVFCICCHGAGGAGDGLVPQRGFPPPPSLLSGKSRQMKDGQLFHLLTYGQGGMAPMAAQLPPDRRWDVINYIRQMQQEAPSASERQPPVESNEGETPAAEPTVSLKLPPLPPDGSRGRRRLVIQPSSEQLGE